MIICNVECAVMNLILWKELHAEVVASVKVAIMHFVQDVDMETPYLMKKSMIISQNFKIKSNPSNPSNP